MVTNNVNFLQLVILSMAEDQYFKEIIDKGLEDVSIGPNAVWESKEDWISAFITNYFNKAKLHIISKQNITNINDVLTHENTIAMRMYSLDIGEEFDFDNFNRIIRFPGGWILKSTLTNVSTFIPLDSEFCTKQGILSKEFKKISNEINVEEDIPF